MDDSAFIRAPPPPPKKKKKQQRERLDGTISCLGVTMVTMFWVRVMTSCTEKEKGWGILSGKEILSHRAERAHACTATVARQIGCLDSSSLDGRI